MKTSRRDFLRLSAMVASAFYIRPFNTFGVFSEAGKFLEKIGISTNMSNNGILAAAGYSFVEENVREFLVPAEQESVFEQKLELLKQSKLPIEVCNSFLPGNLKCVGPSPLHEDILKFGEVSFKRAQQAGIKIIVFGSGGARRIPDGFPHEEAKKQFISICNQLAVLAQKYNVVITLEPLNSQECNFVNSLAEGADIVQKVNHGNFRLLADLYHMLKENESPSNITKYGHLLYHTHIAEKTGRTAPGVNNQDFTPYFKALKEVKYEGRMALECSWKDLENEATTALKVLRNQLNSV